MSGYRPEPLFSAAAEWDLFDVNARVGPSGVHGELALDTLGLLEEMDRFYIRTAVVSHFTAEEYDAQAIGRNDFASGDPAETGGERDGD